MSAEVQTSSEPESAAFRLADFGAEVGLTPVELEPHIRLMAALKMFELGKISSGSAARLAGLSRVDFFETCSRYGVSPFNIPGHEAEQELRAEMELAGA